MSEYATDLVDGVVQHWREINDQISEHAEGWTLDRMPPVDRNILRIAVLELLWRPDVPDRVVIDEAVELAKSISTERSPAFVNGLLGSLAEARTQAPAPDPAPASAEPPADAPAPAGTPAAAAPPPPGTTA